MDSLTGGTPRNFSQVGAIVMWLLERLSFSGTPDVPSRGIINVGSSEMNYGIVEGNAVS